MNHAKILLDVDQIVPGLWQGSMPPFGSLLAEMGFDTLVLCAEEHQRVELYDGLCVVTAPSDDDLREHRMMRDLPIWSAAAEVVAEHVEANKKVLVTCMAGLNRSGMVVALALHRLRPHMTGGEILELIRARRDSALCNTTFARYIMSLPSEIA